MASVILVADVALQRTEVNIILARHRRGLSGEAFRDRMTCKSGPLVLHENLQSAVAGCYSGCW